MYGKPLLLKVRGKVERIMLDAYTPGLTTNDGMDATSIFTLESLHCNAA